MSHSGTEPKVGTPAIYGMNFQTVSTAEKLKSSPATLIGPNAQGNYTEGPSLLGGYVTVDGQQVPGPLLQSALDYVNDALQQMADQIQADGEANRRRSSRDGQARSVPAEQQPAAEDRRRSDHCRRQPPLGPHSIRATRRWSSKRPTTTGRFWWLSNRSQAATDFVKNYLWTHSAPAVNYAGQTITVQHSGLSEIFAGHESAQFFGVSNSDPVHPDVFGIAQVGTIYTTGTKIAEHGGDNPGDRDVPLVVYAPGSFQPGQSSNRVETTQVAPTILKLLGLPPRSLQAVQREGTQVLPGLGNGN